MKSDLNFFGSRLGEVRLEVFKERNFIKQGRFTYYENLYQIREIYIYYENLYKIREIYIWEPLSDWGSIYSTHAATMSHCSGELKVNVLAPGNSGGGEIASRLLFVAC